MSNSIDNPLNGPRLKYDYVSDKTRNVTEDEALIEQFLKKNSGDTTKVMVMRTAEVGGRNLKKKPVKVVKRDENGGIKISIPALDRNQRLLSKGKGSLTDSEYRIKKKRDERHAARLARRAARMNNDSDNK